MTTPKDIIKAMIANLHQQHLKPLGFRKSGKVKWTRPFEWKQVIEVWVCKWSTSDEAKFTVNFGVSIEALHAATESLPITGSLWSFYCDVRAEIGQLLPAKEEMWWTVTADSDAVKLTADIAAKIEQYGLPWFNRLDSYAAVGSELLHQEYPFKAALAFHLGGEAEAAGAAMAQAIERANHMLLPQYRRIALALGIGPTPVPG